MNPLLDVIVNKDKPAMYLTKDNKCAGFDDFDKAITGRRPFCCDMVKEVIPVDIDEKELAALPLFREVIANSGYAFIEVMSGGVNSPNRHFYIYVDDECHRELFANELRQICGGKPIRINQKIRPPYTLHRTGNAEAIPISEQQVEAFIKSTEKVLV
tara:strand:+ start:126 stop:596 length:471 start_codon:yes stop_codon:yes gene_type:complete